MVTGRLANEVLAKAQGSSSRERRAPTTRFGDFHPAEGALVVLAATIYVAIGVTSFLYSALDDTGLAYQGGQMAWQTGHPEQVITWISSPFLALLMALLSRVVSAEQLTIVVTVLNLILFGGIIAYVWWKLRSVVSRTFWWVTLLAAVSFSPIASTIFWKQFNLMALALALAGFALVGRRDRTAGLLVALSLAIKPLVVFLPLAMLWKRDSRRSGIWALVWGALLLAVSQAFLALRAHDWRALSPIPALQNFAYKSLPNTTHWVCIPENYSPQGTWCRLTGWAYWDVKRDALTFAALILVVVCADLLRNRSGRSWAVFGLASALSPLLSPLAWSHYQILLAPLLLVLAYEFWREGARPIQWLALLAGYALCELTLQPFGTLPGLLHALFSGHPESNGAMLEVFAVAQFGQYAVLLTALLWFVWREPVRATQG